MPRAVISLPCPFWVRSGRDALKFRCPLYPRKRTFVSAFWMSALGQKQTHALQQSTATYWDKYCRIFASS
jgi:hypothetical protein